MGNITQTDFGYTFQRGLPGTGLMDYRARFYAPALGRFIQPDSIVPGAGNPQSLNRYSYVSNSPITRIDPSGHSDSDYRDRMNRLRKAYGDKIWFQYRRAYHRGGYSELPVFGDGDDSKFHAQGYWTWYWKTFAYRENDCDLTLLECYYSSPMRFMAFTENQQIDQGQFFDLQVAVYLDLKKMDGGLWPLMPKDLVRGWFDTPFYGGEILFRNELTQRIESLPADTTQVCINGKCSNRNDVNYFAQGMWGAASGQTLEEVYFDAERWKHLKSTALSPDAKYWIEYGFNQYLYFESVK